MRFILLRQVSCQNVTGNVSKSDSFTKTLTLSLVSLSNEHKYMRNLIILFFLTISTVSLAQEQQVAYDYFRKGEYEKAASIYQTLYEQNNFNSNYLIRLIYCQRQLEDFDKTHQLVEEHLKKYPTQIQFYVELGYNYELQYQQEKADLNYNKALSFLEENPNYGYAVGRSFQNNHLLDYALKSYKITMVANPNVNYNIQIAAIYGEKGDVGNMFNTYLDLVEKEDRYFPTVLRYISKYTTDDAENEYNILFKRLVLKRIQTNQLNTWNQLLSWLFMLQKQYGKAFIQEKALYKRGIDTLSLDGIINVGEISFDHSDYSTTKKCFEFVLEHTKNKIDVIDSKLYLLFVAIETIDDLEFIENQFQEFFTEFGKSTNSIDVQIAYADFLTFKKNNPKKGIEVLKETLKLRSNNFQKGAIKINLGDLLVFMGRFNEALIYYSQVQTSLKNHVLAQQARFKVAKTSYYKGDFKWAETQLKVLKGSTSQLIANDALDLSLIINDNSVQDSLKTALKLYAQADLLAFQNKNEQAIDSLNMILSNHKGHAIEDEALFKQAAIYETIGLSDKAVANYLKIIEINAEDILVDDSYYFLAEIYFKQNQLEKAKEYYQKIIFDFASSIYFVDARKKYRLLRGDAIQ